MNDLLLVHNRFRDSLSSFKNEDPQLKKLIAPPFSYSSPLIKEISNLVPGVYTLTGGRQVGKTTLTKQVIKDIIETHKIPVNNIQFFTGEIIDNYSILIRDLQEFLQNKNLDKSKQSYIIVDEITYINNWHRAVKFLADSGALENALLLLTGSDMVFLSEMIKQLPGRRGNSNKVDFHFYPLSFKEYLAIKNISINNYKSIDISILYKELSLYLKTGGYLTAINDQIQYNEIANATYRIYTDWIRGDVLKRNKNEFYLDELLGAIVKRIGSQITWNSLSTDLSINHHKTVADYCEILQNMDALFIQEALREDKLSAAPKKAKKLMFTDPFIANAVCKYLNIPPIDESILIESSLINHVRRKYPTYYIKSTGEIDIAYIKENKIFPIEIKWSANIKSNYFNLLKKYDNSILGAKVNTISKVNNVEIIPLPYLFLDFS